MVSARGALNGETGEATLQYPNPFRPTFGRPPHTLAGRDEAMRRCRAAMSAGPDHPDYSMLLKGSRGSGKTVLLAAIRDMAERHGLTTVRVAAKLEPTFADALIEQMTSASDAERRRMSSDIVGYHSCTRCFRSPETTITVKERIIATCRAHPEATHAAIAARVGTSPDYVGRVRRADSASPGPE